jgi:hypothetical protein
MRPTDWVRNTSSVTFVARAQRSPVLLGIVGACCLFGVVVAAALARPGVDQRWPVGTRTSPEPGTVRSRV